MKSELEFLKHFLWKLEECGLDDTYLNGIIECRKLIEERISEVKKCAKHDVILPFPLSSPLEIWQTAREMNSNEFRDYYNTLINAIKNKASN
jgi:hypothetical protein